MKKLLIAGIISIMACSAYATPLSSELTITPVQAEVVQMHVASCAKKPKVITKGDRVIIIYDDGKTIVVDRDGSITVVPAP